MIMISKVFVIVITLFTLVDCAYARVYLDSERFHTQESCEPRIFCNILKDYVITEPKLIRPILKPYQRLKEEARIIDESNNLNVQFTFNSSYVENKSDTYWTTFNGIGIKNDLEQTNFTNIWGIQGLWQPIDLSGRRDRRNAIKSERDNYFYLARYEVFNLLNRFLALRSPDNIFGVVISSRKLDLYNFSIPIVQKFFKDETFLYQQKLANMDSLLSIHESYNELLSKKIINHNGIHFYEPSFYRLKNMVLNSIDAITLEFTDFVENHLDLSNYKVCTKKAYLQESVQRQLFDLKLKHEELNTRYQDNLSGFSFSAGGELNEPMNLTFSVGFGMSYSIFENDFNKMNDWDYLVARKTISDDFAKNIELEEDFLKETFLMTRSYLENYIQTKNNREQVYLILKGKIINRIGSKNFKFGFNEVPKKVRSLERILSVETLHTESLFRFANSLFVGLSQCIVSEEIVEELENQ